MTRIPVVHSAAVPTSSTLQLSRSQVSVQDWFVTSVPSSNRSSTRGPLRIWGVPWPPRAPAGVSKKSKYWLWRSSSICRRISATEVETRFGTRINLRGPLHERSGRKVCMTEAAISAFRDGFPRNWRVASVDAFNVVTRRVRDHPSPTPRSLPKSPVRPLESPRETAVTMGKQLRKRAKIVVTKVAAHRRADIAKARFAAASDFSAAVDHAPSNGSLVSTARPPRPAHAKNSRGPRDRLRRRMRECAPALVAVPISDLANVRTSADAKELLSKRRHYDAASVEKEEGSPRKILKRDAGQRHAKYNSPPPARTGEENEETEEEEDSFPGKVPTSALTAFKVAMRNNSSGSDLIAPVTLSGREQSKLVDYISISRTIAPAANLTAAQIRNSAATDRSKTRQEGASAATSVLKRASRRLQSLAASAQEGVEASNPSIRTKSRSKSLKGAPWKHSKKRTTRAQALTEGRIEENPKADVQEKNAAVANVVEDRFSEYTRRLRNVRAKSGTGRNVEAKSHKSVITDTAGEGDVVKIKSKSVVKPSKKKSAQRKSISQVLKRPKASMRRVAFTDELDSVEEVVRPSSAGRRAARLARALGPKSSLRPPRSPPPANLSPCLTLEKAADVIPTTVTPRPLQGLKAGNAAGSANGFWSSGQVAAYERMRSSVAGDRPDYWTVVAEGVPGRTAEECHARWAASWVSPVKRAARGTVGGSKVMSTPEIAAQIARVAPTKEHRKTAKFRTNMRRIAAAAARSADDAEFEPVLTDGEPSSSHVTPRFAAPDLPDGTPGSLIREKRKELDEAGRIDTPEILARGRAVGLAEADKFVALFKKRLAKAARRKDTQMSSAAGPGDLGQDVGPVARDLLKEMKDLGKMDKRRLSLGSEAETPERAEYEEDSDLFF